MPKNTRSWEMWHVVKQRVFCCYFLKIPNTLEVLRRQGEAFCDSKGAKWNLGFMDSVLPQPGLTDSITVVR